MNNLFTYLNKPSYKHILYWMIVFFYYVAVDKYYYNTTEQLLIVKFVFLLFQIMTAYSIVYFVIPRYRIQKNIFESSMSLFGLFVLLNIFYAIWQHLVYGLNSDTCYAIFKQNYGHLPFWEQVLSFRKNFTIISWLFVQPTFFLIAFLWYEKNLKLSVANEHKKIAELDALKNQLNPHFLFNTLNNLYSLTLDKSEKAPQVIEHLSDILDYMLYRCDDTFVFLSKEIELIENYLALEKIRYTSRVEINFDKKVDKEVKIAPLLLLTLIENAFKHGVSQELRQARVSISLETKNDDIVFSVKNTKPSQTENTLRKTKALGLKNIKKQLNLLYPNVYSLEIDEDEERYSVVLTLKQN
ncbi:sensor histidine kinase [Bernardetia sp. OM2101]|uniref:sensor histidine kinase n=1 Tax=Bernardetia sp. OM2101 TaxID=3344876 RepID=UPI0035CF1CD9